MLLSIVIPMYNAEPYIGKCLDSILYQDIDHCLYEIVIVNDGSTDESSSIVRKYIQKYPFIKLYNQVNQGQSAARNYGMSMANGDYIQFIDADDFLIENSLSRVVDFTTNGHPHDEPQHAYDIITFDLTEGKADSMPVNRGGGDCKWIGNGYDYIATHNYNNGPWYYWLNRSFVKKHNLRFEEGKLCEDGMFTLTALLNAATVAHVDSLVYYYALRSNSTTKTLNKERRRKLIDGFIYAIGYFGRIIEKHKGNMSTECLDRILTRRDSYVFFLMIRLLRMGAYQEAKNAIDNLRAEGIYPIRYFIGKDYNGIKLRMITACLNNRQLFFALCRINGIILRICSR